MPVTCSTPTPDELSAIARRLDAWQDDPWAGQLHTGDLGWHSAVGTERLAQDLRLWQHDHEPVAIGMLDGPEVLRMAFAPGAARDGSVAQELADDVHERAPELLTGSSVIVEARGATAFRQALQHVGWVEDEPWTPMTLDLRGAVDLPRAEANGLRVVEAGPDAADDWTGVHWSAFRGTPYDDEARSRFVARWRHIVTGPFADRGHHLIGHDRRGVPVAVTTVWTAGPGRPGLIEPMGVHRDHHGQGHGVAITLAGARTLQHLGASSAVVVAEGSNPAALATYRSAGFTALAPVADLRRP